MNATEAFRIHGTEILHGRRPIHPATLDELALIVGFAAAQHAERGPATISHLAGPHGAALSVTWAMDRVESIRIHRTLEQIVGMDQVPDIINDPTGEYAVLHRNTLPFLRPPEHGR